MKLRGPASAQRGAELIRSRFNRSTTLQDTLSPYLPLGPGVADVRSVGKVHQTDPTMKLP